MLLYDYNIPPFVYMAYYYIQYVGKFGGLKGWQMGYSELIEG